MVVLTGRSLLPITFVWALLVVANHSRTGFVAADPTISANQTAADYSLLANQDDLTYDMATCPGTTDKSCKCAVTRNYDCQAGSYCPLPPYYYDVQPQPCTLGFYCPDNTAQPVHCCPGYYCPDPSTIKICPKGHFCRTGQIEPTRCAPLSNCPEGTKEQKKVGSLAVFVGLAGLMAIGYAIAEYSVYRHRKLKTAKREAKKKEHVELKASLQINLAPKTDTYTIQFNELGLTLPGGRVIMDGVNGELLPGKVTAVMGPSGAGKTTFLSLISGKVKKTKGTIRINGVEEPLGLSKFKKLVGFVPQEDIMLRMMTVKEILVFSARYRLPSNMKDHDKIARVAEVMDVLGLTDIMYSAIGDERQRGISGGQRKRVNIGMELVADPSILFLDEPTSGLDSTSSDEVCNCLRKISSLGITIATVIHQPRYEILQRIDNLLLLGKGGRTVYIGPTKDALPYFTEMGYILPPHGNPADFYMDVVSGKSYQYAPKQLTKQVLEGFDVKDLILFVQHQGLSDSAIDTIASLRITGHRLSNMTQEEINSSFGDNSSRLLDVARNPTNYEYLKPNLEFSREQLFEAWDRKAGTFGSETAYAKEDSGFELPFVSQFISDVQTWYYELKEALFGSFFTNPFRQTPGFGWQFLFCFWRSFVQTYRDRAKIIADCFLHMFAGLFLGVASNGLEYIGPIPVELSPACPYELLVQNKCELPLSDNFVQSGNLICWAIGFAGIAVGSGTFGNEKVVFWRDSSAGLHPFGYFFAKVAADIPRSMLSGTLFYLAYVFVFSPVGRLDHLYLLILILYWAGFSCGYFISQLVHVEVAPLVGIAFALIWSVVFSGSNPRLPDVADTYGPASQTLWDISYARWGIEAYYIINVGPFKHEYVDAGLDYWGYDLNNFWACIGRIFGICLLWQFLALVAMLLKDREKKK